jgi:hypothetical protein
MSRQIRQRVYLATCYLRMPMTTTIEDSRNLDFSIMWDLVSNLHDPTHPAYENRPGVVAAYKFLYDFGVLRPSQTADNRYLDDGTPAGDSTGRYFVDNGKWNEVVAYRASNGREVK